VEGEGWKRQRRGGSLKEREKPRANARRKIERANEGELALEGNQSEREGDGEEDQQFLAKEHVSGLQKRGVLKPEGSQERMLWHGIDRNSSI
jgi:hypothetical protein